MVAVQVANKDALDVARMKSGVQQLVLGAFAAVEKPQPRLRRVLQIQQHCCYVASSGWHARGCT